MLDDPGSSTALSNGSIMIAVVLLFMSAVFSGSETAIFSLSAIRIRQLVDKGVTWARTVRRLLSDAHGLLSTLLIGNNIVNTWLTSLVTSIALATLARRYSREVAELAASAITTVLLLLFGEVTPKAIAAHDPEGFALAVSRPVAVLKTILHPLTRVLNAFTSWFVDTIGGRDKTPTVSVTEDVIKTAAAIGEEAGAIESDERAMIYGVFASDDTPVTRAMVPRQNIVAVEAGEPIEQVLQKIVASGLSRLPVYEGDIDHIVGLIYAKDLFVHFRRRRKGLRTTSLLRPAHFVRATSKVKPLLAELRAKSTQLAIVLGPDDRVVGLITLEDLLEEVIGEIEDEHDTVLTSGGALSPAKAVQAE